MLRHHVEDACPDRVVQCKFSRLGCDWKGPAHKMASHAKKCAFLSMSGDTLLEALATADSKEAAKKAAEKQLEEQQQAVLASGSAEVQ